MRKRAVWSPNNANARAGDIFIGPPIVKGKEKGFGYF